MKAMVLRRVCEALVPEDRAIPVPGPGQVRLQVAACAVCRTDLHVVDGELPATRTPIVPGHEVIGRIEALGPGVDRFRLGERVGVPWLGWTCGRCVYCLSGRENLCPQARFTGWQIDGGYAEYMVAPLEALAATPAGSVRSAVVKTGATRGVFVEARARIGGDTGIPQPGCLCAVIDTSISTGEGPIRVLPLNATGNMLRATLTAGKWLAFEGVNVTCVAVNADGSAVAEITSVCTAANCPAPATCNPDGGCSSG